MLSSKMSAFSDDIDETPEPALSEVCVNLENKFLNMEDINKGEGMHIYARIRPMLDSEKEAGFKECIGILDDQVVRAVIPASSAKYKMSSHLTQDIIEDFTFTFAYGPETGQFVFFEECMMDTMQNFIEGQNSLVFTYGTTGSGKSYTLQGNTDNPGIIPLSLHLFFASIEDQLFDSISVKPDKFADVILLNDNEIKRELEIKEQILSACIQEEWNFRNSSSSKSFAMMLCDTFSEKFEGEGRQTTLCSEDMAQAQAAALMKEISKKSANKQSGFCSVWVSFIEIYNESIYDLLQPNVNQRSKLNLGEDKNGDVFVKGLQEVCVFNSFEALKVFNFGQKNLKIASTKLNYQSSRSHCIFTIKVVRVPEPDNMTRARVNRLSFCDLAGSERAAKSQTTGLRLKEAGSINTSLLVLGKCIDQLRLKPSLREKKLIPFRESKLTRLFSGFFTGKGKAVMITNVSPSEVTFDETSHVLKFSAVAKELIINDSYIVTAANTLQSITNMWTNGRTNCKDISTASDKSISFEDSFEGAIQEKDELIEKLLDLAESLKSNLEREKKEKAELELKIRQDVCQEYSEYSDELLEVQKDNYEKEREAIKQIYEKRIMSMEKMYEKVIEDYKLQLDENESSIDEMSTSAAETTDSKDIKMQSISGQCSKDENVETTESVCETNNTADKIEVLKASRNFKGIDDYSICLESEIESLTKKLEDTQLMLQNTMKDNENMKKELDSYKINCFAYKIEVDDLAKKRTAVEHDMRALAEDLTAISEEKEKIFQELTNSNKTLASYNDEVQNLLKRIDELMKVQEKSNLEYKESLEEANIKTNNVNTQLSATLCELEKEREKRKNAENLAKTMELEVFKLQNIEKSSTLIKETLESLTKEIEGLKEENVMLKNKVETAKHSEGSYSLTTLKDEIEKLNAIHIEEVKKLSDTIKQHKLENIEAEEILKSVNKTLEKALFQNEDQKKKLETHVSECVSLKNEIAQLLCVKEDLERKLESTERDCNHENSELEKALEKAKEEIANFDNLKSEHQVCKEKMDELQKANLDLRNKLSVTSEELDQERSKTSELQEALEKAKKQIVELNILEADYQMCKDTNAEFQKANLDLKEKCSTVSKELDQERSKTSELKEALEKAKKQIVELNILEADYQMCKDTNAEFQKANLDLKEKCSTVSKELEEERNKQSELKEALEKAKEQTDHPMYKNKIDELENANLNLEEKISTASKELGLKENIIFKNKVETTEHAEESYSLSTLKDNMQKLNTIRMEEVKRLSYIIKQQNMEATETLKSVKNLEFKNEDKKKKLESHESECVCLKNEITQLLSIKDDLGRKLESTDLSGISKLVLLLENCEMKATHKINKMQSDLKELKEYIELSSVDHKQECATLLKLIEILEKCEAFSSSRIKQFHTSALDHVEQIMDQKKYIEAKDKVIKDLNNDKDALHRQLKDLQTSSKKELQTEKQQFMSQISNLKNKFSASEKLNESLKCEVSKLQLEVNKFESETKNLKLEMENRIYESKVEMDKLEIENKNLKLEVEKRNELQANMDELQTENEKLKIKKENTPKEKTPEAKMLEMIKRGSISEERILAIRIPKLIFKEDTLNEKTPEKKTSKKIKNQGDKRKTKTEKSEVTEDAKQKTEIYEEPDANTNKVNMKKECRVGRRHFRCVENVVQQLDLVQKEVKNSAKSQTSKRKELYESEDKYFENKALKKVKLSKSNNDTENFIKPQNMRVRLLKGALAVNNIAMPSPRMTRGRKRLIQSKDNINQTASPRTVRS